MMLDRNPIAVSPASVWRVLHQAGRLSRWNRKPSKKGTGFHQSRSPTSGMSRLQGRHSSLAELLHIF